MIQDLLDCISIGVMPETTGRWFTEQEFYELEKAIEKRKEVEINSLKGDFDDYFNCYIKPKILKKCSK